VAAVVRAQELLGDGLEPLDTARAGLHHGGDGKRRVDEGALVCSQRRAEPRVGVVVLVARAAGSAADAHLELLPGQAPPVRLLA
jgi:hypothetical protein